ncbi:hypothetical protein GEMRC1_002844 [Eukaryota sp. GEM-RC1]
MTDRFVELAKLYKRVKSERDALLQSFQYCPVGPSPPSLNSVRSTLSSLSSYYELHQMQNYDRKDPCFHSDCPFKFKVNTLSNDLAANQDQLNTLKQLLSRARSRLKELDYSSLKSSIFDQLPKLSSFSECFLVQNLLFVPHTVYKTLVPQSEYSQEFLILPLSELSSSDHQLVTSSFKELTHPSTLNKLLHEKNQLSEMLDLSQSQLNDYKLSQQSLLSKLSDSLVPSTTADVESQYVQTEPDIMYDDQSRHLINLTNENSELKKRLSFAELQLSMQSKPKSTSSQSSSHFSLDPIQLNYLQSVLISFCTASGNVKKDLVHVISDLLKFNKEQEQRLLSFYS